jgi:hypothetical protein
MASALDNLKMMFRESFGTPIDQIIPLKDDLVPIDGPVLSSLMFGSPVAAQEQFLIQSDIDPFMTSCPQDYFLIGFGGHGINSSAFYYSRVDSWSRILFRLPYGGVYTDNDAMAKLIVQFLTSYFGYEQKLREAVKNFVAIESMHKGYYKIEMPDGNIFELNKSLLAAPDFELKFALFLAGYGA